MAQLSAACLLAAAQNAGDDVEWLFWIYIFNLSLLILHEMDSTYWREWRMFKIPGGITTYLLLHLPLYIFFLATIPAVKAGTPFGLVAATILAAAGIFAFGIHIFFIRKGRKEFRTTQSWVILTGALIAGILQLCLILSVLA